MKNNCDVYIAGSNAYPYVLKYQHGLQEARKYMSGIYNTILLNDIVRRLKVAETTLDETVLTRELTPLRIISDNYPKYLITMDELFGEMNYDGIQKVNALKWLLE